MAYNLLADLTASETEMASPQQEFMRLPLVERRRIMAQQAGQMVAHYERAFADKDAPDIVHGRTTDGEASV